MVLVESEVYIMNEKRFELACNAASQIVAAMVKKGMFDETAHSERTGEIARIYAELAETMYQNIEHLP